MRWSDIVDTSEIVYFLVAKRESSQLTVSGITYVLRGKTKAAPREDLQSPQAKGTGLKTGQIQIFRFFSVVHYLQNITLTLFTEIT